MWDSWTTFRAKSIFEDTESMNLKNIEEMTPQAIWEYKKGANIKDDDIEKAINQKNECIKEVDDVFKKYDFLILPSAQVFPFDKNLQFPKKINHFEKLKIELMLQPLQNVMEKLLILVSMEPINPEMMQF